MEDTSLRAAYLEDWLDTIEALPGELQRNFTMIRDLDAMSQDLIKDIQVGCQTFMDTAKEVPAENRKLMLRQLTEAFTKSLKHGEAKVSLATQTYDMIDRHIRRLDEDLQRFEDELMMTGPKMAGPRVSQMKESATRTGESPMKKRRLKEGSHPAKGSSQHASSHVQAQRDGRKEKQQQPRRDSNATAAGGRKVKDPIKKKLTAALLAEEAKRHDNPDLPVDPNEPTYCICDQVSYGEMIGCDNEECEIEWFHYGCMGLDSPPKGKWYCDDCRSKLGL